MKCYFLSSIPFSILFNGKGASWWTFNSDMLLNQDSGESDLYWEI